jgi:hypothetical protein
LIVSPSTHWKVVSFAVCSWALVALHDPVEPTFAAIATYILWPLAGLIALLLIIGALRRRAAPQSANSPLVEECPVHLR